jgi:ABC-type sulfate/molybdate transport systems ATPase subunit
LSEPLVSSRPKAPWLAVEIDHRFQHGSANFHLRVAFQAHAARTIVFGPSGSGKSSLLRAIAGLLEPDSGNIQIHGESVWRRMREGDSSRGVPVEKRHVGLVMQTPAVFPHLTVAGNVAFALRQMDKPAQKERVSRLLQMVHAEVLADRWPRELSGGQLQRVAIARTLAADPKILLLDEPFSALDAKSRQQLSESLQRWASEYHVPVLTVTHNLEEAFSAGEDVLTIHEGRIEAQGPPSTVLAAERDRLLRAMAAVPNPQET